MNNLKVFALLVLVAAGSQLLAAQEEPLEAPKVSDSEEVAALDEKSAALSGFCLEIRDYVTSSVRNKAAGLRSAVAGILESSRRQLRRSGDQVQERARQLASEEGLRKVDELVSEGQKSLGERLSEAPLSPSSLLSGARRAWARANSYVVEQQRALGRRLQESPVDPSAVFSSALAGLNQAGGAFKKGFSSAREATLRLMGDTCKLMADYEREIQSRFEALKAGDPSLEGLSLDQVECVSVSGITNMLKACRQQKME